ncbi:VOC family protein [Streptomyces daliensis]
MTALPEGSPCWADAMFTDVEGAKAFYGEVLGWTFGESASEFGNYTQAYKDGKAVAAVVPPMPGEEGPRSAWCLYLASPDAAATAQKVRDNGGEVLMGPMRVDDFGTMLIARDPTGVTFGVWQAGVHEGFEASGETGTYCWAEIFTREPERSDAFFTSVFPYRARRMVSDEVDFVALQVGENTVLGRLKMSDQVPADAPPSINLYFGVDDCDAAVERATRNGGVLRFGPQTTPFGRLAAVSDPQGASFVLLDTGTTAGGMPEWKDA